MHLGTGLACWRFIVSPAAVLPSVVSLLPLGAVPKVQSCCLDWEELCDLGGGSRVVFLWSLVRCLWAWPFGFNSIKTQQL